MEPLLSIVYKTHASNHMVRQVSKSTHTKLRRLPLVDRSRGQKRTTWDTEGQTTRSMTENEHMEAMLEAFHDMDEDNDGGHNVGGSMDTTELP